MAYLNPPATAEAHDPRVHLQEDIVSPEHFVVTNVLAPDFETYLYYAQEQRGKEAAEARREGHRPPTGWLNELFGLNRLGDQLLHFCRPEKCRIQRSRRSCCHSCRVSCDFRLAQDRYLGCDLLPHHYRYEKAIQIVCTHLTGEVDVTRRLGHLRRWDMARVLHVSWRSASWQHTVVLSSGTCS
jgi:hypothetical protein